jgi:hypothetical protein
MTKKDLQDLYGLLTQLKNERLDKYAKEGYNVVAMDPEELYELDDGDMLLSCADGVLGVIEDKLS